MFIRIVSIPQAVRFASINADLALRLSPTSYTENNRKGAQNAEKAGEELCALGAFAVDFIRCGALAGMRSFGGSVFPRFVVRPLGH